MSSNELHITRANYEAYFLMYVDGELTPAENDAVEAFAALHPDLQEELDLLLTTKLDAETITFDKGSLMAESMKQNVIDESLLLYIDNELTGEDKKALEQKLSTNSTYQYQHHLLQQAKLPAEVIPYPNKAELYRRTERKLRPVIWYRAAAAVFVVMASGYMWYLTQNTVSTNRSVAVEFNTPATHTPSAPSNQATGSTTTPLSETSVAATTENNTTSPVQQEEVTASYTQSSITSNTTTNSYKQENTTPRVDVSASSQSTDEYVVSAPVASVAESQQQVLNNSTVTSLQPPALNTIEEVTTGYPGNDQAVALETEDNKRGSVKGFLRKATRFIERRTGVSATNEDDELLIGAVAIKLK